MDTEEAEAHDPAEQTSNSLASVFARDSDERKATQELCCKLWYEECEQEKNDFPLDRLIRFPGIVGPKPEPLRSETSWLGILDRKLRHNETMRGTTPA